MLDTIYIKERQREWAPDPGFFSQCKAFSLLYKGIIMLCIRENTF